MGDPANPDTSPAQRAEELRAELRRMDPRMLATVHTMREQFAAETSQPRFESALFGVFAAVFLFNAVYTLTVLEARDLKNLKKFEDRTAKKLLKTNHHPGNLNWRQLQWLFLYRLLMSLVVFAAFMTPVIVIFWAVANRGQIPPNW